MPGAPQKEKVFLAGCIKKPEDLRCTRCGLSFCSPKARRKHERVLRAFQRQEAAMVEGEVFAYEVDIA